MPCLTGMGALTYLADSYSSHDAFHSIPPAKMPSSFLARTATPPCRPNQGVSATNCPSLFFFNRSHGFLQITLNFSLPAALFAAGLAALVTFVSCSALMSGFSLAVSLKFFFHEVTLAEMRVSSFVFPFSAFLNLFLTFLLLLGKNFAHVSFSFPR